MFGTDLLERRRLAPATDVISPWRRNAAELLTGKPAREEEWFEEGRGTIAVFMGMHGKHSVSMSGKQGIMIMRSTNAQNFILSCTAICEENLTNFPQGFQGKVNVFQFSFFAYINPCVLNTHAYLVDPMDLFRPETFQKRSCNCNEKLTIRETERRLREGIPVACAIFYRR